MLRPINDKELKDFLDFTLAQAKNGDFTIEHLKGNICSYLDKRGYHVGLPSSIEWALNSGDGTYRP